MPHPEDELPQSTAHLMRTAEQILPAAGNHDLAAARAHTVQARDALQHPEHALVPSQNSHAEPDHESLTLGTQKPTEELPREDTQDGSGSHRRVLMSDVDQTLGLANLIPLPRLAPPGSHGLKLGQMKDVVIVHCGASTKADTLALRDHARRALRDGGYLVKDSPRTAALLYVVAIL